MGGSRCSGLGTIDPNSERGKALLGKRALHEAAARVERDKNMEAYLAPLERKDELALKAEGVKMIKVKAWRCHECKYFHEKALDSCKANHSHRLQLTSDVTKRFFECRKCRHHISVLNERLPSKACDKCGSEGSWKEAGMRKTQKAATASDEFLARGVEHGKFLNSGSGGASVAPLQVRPQPQPNVAFSNSFAPANPILD